MRARAPSTVLAVAVSLGLLVGATSGPAEGGPAANDELRPASEFATIENDEERAAALFAELGRVLLHPRCVNCHPAGDTPHQGDERRVHEPPVVRGSGGLGAIGMQCATCHGKENFDPGGVPGAPHWRLAPSSMAWQGLTLAELCAQISDPERNGDRTIEEIVEHLVEDDLVAWGWAPGAGREAVPGPHERFAALVEAWAASGAGCPAE